LSRLCLKCFQADLAYEKLTGSAGTQKQRIASPSENYPFALVYTWLTFCNQTLLNVLASRPCVKKIFRTLLEIFLSTPQPLLDLLIRINRTLIKSF